MWAGSDVVPWLVAFATDVGLRNRPCVVFPNITGTDIASYLFK